MSFSTEVKNELCSVSMSRACCTRAEAYGALLHASVFSHKEIRLSAENAVVVRRLQALLQRAFFVDSEAESCGRKQQLIINDPPRIGRIFDALGYDRKNHITYHLNRNVLEEDCCIAAFLRGAFLMAGTVAGPDKKSHLELKSTHQSLTGEETSLMLDLGLAPKQARRASAQLLYFKDSASVEDFLTRIGAPHDQPSGQLRDGEPRQGGGCVRAADRRDQKRAARGRGGGLPGQSPRDRASAAFLPDRQPDRAGAAVRSADLQAGTEPQAEKDNRICCKGELNGTICPSACA